MSNPLYASSFSVKAVSPNAPPSAIANHGNQQQLVANRNAKVLPIMDVEIFIKLLIEYLFQAAYPDRISF